MIRVQCAAQLGYSRPNKKPNVCKSNIMAIGACIQNMLLAACELDLGACWLGEILNRKRETQKFLKVSPQYELMAVVATGHPAKIPKSTRKSLTELFI
jgi:nitroreductase